MPHFICTTCGTPYADADEPPAACAICQDERQYVKATGQQWTTLDKLSRTNRNSIKFKEPGRIGIGIDPHFAIGQRALFLHTPQANVLWDCLPLLDEAVVEMVKALDGVSAIAISHPHCQYSRSKRSRRTETDVVESDHRIDGEAGGRTNERWTNGERTATHHTFVGDVDITQSRNDKRSQKTILDSIV